jgi:hypothetical protein
MKLVKSTKVEYKREKNKVEIIGESNHTHWQIWFDLVSNKILYFFLLLALFFSESPSDFVIMVIKWANKNF